MHSHSLRVHLATVFLFLLPSACRTPQPAVTPMNPISTDVTQKLDQGLRALVEAARSKDPAAIERAAKDRSIPLENGLVRVQITAAKEEDIPLIEKRITDAKGQIVAHLKVVIFALLPPSQIEEFAAHPAIWNITLPPTAAPVHL